MIKNLLVIAIILLSSAAAYGEQTFASNELGMELQSISPAQAADHEWILTVTKSNNREVKVLVKKGEEMTRWVDTLQQGRLSSESKYEKGVLVQTSEYRNGHPVRLVEYTDGEKTLIRDYQYSGNLLVRISVSNAKGAVLYTDSYAQGTDGRLRRAVREVSGGGSSVISLTYDGNRVASEWLGNGTGGVLNRYTNGELVSKESWAGVKLESEERISGGPTGKTSVTKEVTSGKTTTKVYDSNGQIQSEQTTEKGAIVRSVDYQYDTAGKLTTMVVKTPGQREEVRYEYDSHGDRLTSRTTVNRQLIKVTHYTGKDSYFEDLYLNGAVVLHVFYEKGKKVREVPASSRDSIGAPQGAGG